MRKCTLRILHKICKIQHGYTVKNDDDTEYKEVFMHCHLQQCLTKSLCIAFYLAYLCKWLVSVSNHNQHSLSKLTEPKLDT